MSGDIKQENRISKKRESKGRLSLVHSHFLDRVSMRRASRHYSLTADQSNIKDPKTRVTLEWKNLGAELEKPNWLSSLWRRKGGDGPEVLMKRVSGSVGPGDILLVLGSSGSGKTLLLNALAGRLVPGVSFTGDIKVNGSLFNRDYIYAVAFIPQSTSFLDELMTVEESLVFTSTLCLPQEYKSEERKERIDFVLTKLGLRDSASSRISDLSHGERKRLAIAQQLLREPRVMILDEPTTGLDSTSAKTLINQLHLLTITDNITMIMSLHQPRSVTYDLFSSVTLLTRGQQVYYGSNRRILGYFRQLGFNCSKEENPADFLVELVSEKQLYDEDGQVKDGIDEEGRKRIDLLIESWAKSSESHTVECNKARKSAPLFQSYEYNASRWCEIKTLFQRELLHWRRCGRSFFLTLLGNILLGVFLGFIWFQIPDDGYQAVQNRIGVVQFIPKDRAITIAILLVVATSKERVIAERGTLMYRSSSHFAAFMLFYWLIEIVYQTLYSIVYYYIAGLKATPFTAILIQIGLQTLMLTALYSIGIIVPFFTRSPKSSFTVGMLIWYILALFNGLYANLSEVSWVLRWICYLSPEFYYFTGAVQNEFAGLTLDGQPGEFWLDLYALDTVSTMWCAGALMILNVAAALASYLVLKFRTRPRFAL